MINKNFVVNNDFTSSFLIKKIMFKNIYIIGTYLK